jgi:hypothetical protein
MRARELERDLPIVRVFASPPAGPRSAVSALDIRFARCNGARLEDAGIGPAGAASAWAPGVWAPGWSRRCLCARGVFGLDSVDSARTSVTGIMTAGGSGQQPGPCAASMIADTIADARLSGTTASTLSLETNAAV